jgi:hemerythrin-like metal-binding protein
MGAKRVSVSLAVNLPKLKGNTMEWSNELALDNERMDETHREFVELVNALSVASDAAMLPALDALLRHTEAHFGQEERWMAQSEFPPTHCHLEEHAGVLGAMREARNYVSEGKYQVGQVLARELEPWFRQHAATMDTMLAQWLRTRNVDTSACESTTA